MQYLPILEELFRKPPIPYEPAKHSLKAWAMYCLRDRGFKVVYAEKGDFAIEAKGGEKTYFRVTEGEPKLDEGSQVWIVYDSTTKQTRILLPQNEKE
ncbi:hypothetical protein K9N68_24180 [Kovacikia minuta CCNUW1]|uniref:hypothetical protein n=1 Tax=Kovacikia minuta TaxID=2931930 RepID=UPI001CCE8B50|nr:hypothetical protein [Kovacikia minuta]UBF24742.1 hypothetical protein K9N68_24180 [Kovacikia minuta CCNUW1]